MHKSRFLKQSKWWHSLKIELCYAREPKIVELVWIISLLWINLFEKKIKYPSYSEEDHSKLHQRPLSPQASFVAIDRCLQKAVSSRLVCMCSDQKVLMEASHVRSWWVGNIGGTNTTRSLTLFRTQWGMEITESYNIIMLCVLGRKTKNMNWKVLPVHESSCPQWPAWCSSRRDPRRENFATSRW